MGAQQGVRGMIASRAVDKGKASGSGVDAVLTGHGGKRRFGTGHADEAKMTPAVPSPRAPIGTTTPILQALA